jgi:hypothetical protein
MIKFGFSEAVRESEQRYPLLAEALKAQAPARMPRIEWMTDDGNIEFNYCQIVRVPFGVKSFSSEKELDEALEWLRGDAMHEHLRDVEQILRFGHRDVRDQKRFCGGVREFAPGKLALRPLRELELVFRHTDDPEVYEEEWISEISLQVG